MTKNANADAVPGFGSSLDTRLKQELQREVWIPNSTSSVPCAMEYIAVIKDVTNSTSVYANLGLQDERSLA